MLSKWRNIENFNSVKSERVVMNYSDSRPTCTSAKSFNRQDFSQNNRAFYIPKTVGFGCPTVTGSTPKRYWCELHYNIQIMLETLSGTFSTLGR